MERTKRVITTALGRMLICPHMVLRSHCEPVGDWRNMAAYTYKVATIRLLLGLAAWRPPFISSAPPAALIAPPVGEFAAKPCCPKRRACPTTRATLRLLLGYY